MRSCDVGTEAYRNVSHGCFRMRADDAAFLYSFLGYGDRVRILNNG
jgi:lipoprotein-anchoring transpeptidase ErfK/SrfK